MYERFVKTILLFAFFAAVLPRAAAKTKMISIKRGTYAPLYYKNKAKIQVAGFKVDETVVTNQEFLQFVKKHPQYRRSKIANLFADKSYLKHWLSDTSFKSSQTKVPVTYVSWFVARKYCQSLGKSLPTVDQWEYLASFGEKRQYEPGLAKQILAWYSRPSSQPIGQVYSQAKNALGVYDLHGLTWEWVEDFNTALVTGESRGDGELDRNLFCGSGSSGATDVQNYGAFMRYAFRSSLEAKFTVKNLSFRCVKG